MFLKIKNLLTAPEIERLQALSRELHFVDGKISNPANTSKQNLQADPADPKYAESVQIVGNAFARSRDFASFAMPKRVAPPMLCRYEPGMKYGAHADAAIMQLPNARIRSDLSCTVFVGVRPARQSCTRRRSCTKSCRSAQASVSCRSPS